METSVSPIPVIPVRGPRTLSVPVVDDHAVIGPVVTTLLRRLGHTADVVADGHAALEAATGHDYDAVLMDIQMPGMDGLDATRLIRKSESNPQRPLILAVSAVVSSEDRALYRQAGLDDFLAKPVRLSELALTLDHGFSPVQPASAAGASSRPISTTNRRPIEPTRRARWAWPGDGRCWDGQPENDPMLSVLPVGSLDGEQWARMLVISPRGNRMVPGGQVISMGPVGRPGHSPFVRVGLESRSRQAVRYRREDS